MASEPRSPTTQPAPDEIDRDVDFHRLLLDLVRDPLMVIGRDYGIRYANRAARALSPLDDPAGRGMRCYQLSHRRETPCDEPCPLQQVLETRLPVNVRHVHLDAQGAERIFDLTATPISSASGHVVEMVEVCRDVTEREDLRQRQRALRRRLMQAQKLETARDLAGGVAHDFNNLLTVIMSFTELAGESIPPSDPAREDLDEVLEAAARARNLIRQMLVFTRRSTGEARLTDVTALIGQMQPMLRRLVPAHTALRVDLPDRPLSVRVDPGLLHQAMVSLIANARDATADGGAIDVRARLVTLAQPLAAIGGSIGGGNWVRVTVADDGCGIDGADLPRIFEPFYTTREDRQAIGLGLPMLLGAVEASGGRLCVASTVGEGSAFDLYLPLADTGPEAADSDPRPAPGSGRSILVVDDDPGICRIVRRALTQQGHEVLVAGDGVEALEIWKKAPRPIDLVVTDAVMPRMGGLALARELRREVPEQPILLMSGYLDGDTAPDTLARQGIRLVAKPFIGSDMAAVVAEVLAGRPGADAE